MSDSSTPETESAPQGNDEFVADVKARVRASRRAVEETWPDTVVVWPDAEDIPDPQHEIERIDS